MCEGGRHRSTVGEEIVRLTCLELGIGCSVRLQHAREYPQIDMRGSCGCEHSAEHPALPCRYGRLAHEETQRYMPGVSHRHWHRSQVGSREFAFALIRILVRDEPVLFDEARSATAASWPMRVSQPLGATATQSAAERAESATTEVDVQGVAVQSQMADGERRRMERMEHLVNDCRRG